MLRARSFHLLSAERGRGLLLVVLLLCSCPSLSGTRCRSCGTQSRAASTRSRHPQAPRGRAAAVVGGRRARLAAGGRRGSTGRGADDGRRLDAVVEEGASSYAPRPARWRRMFAAGRATVPLPEEGARSRGYRLRGDCIVARAGLPRPVGKGVGLRGSGGGMGRSVRHTRGGRGWKRGRLVAHGRRRRRALRERARRTESPGAPGQSTLEYLLMLVVFIAMIGALALLWHAVRDGELLARSRPTPRHTVGRRRVPMLGRRWSTEMVGIGERSGQTSVEGGLLVPVVLTLVALLVQPACVLYTRAVMASTAAG